MYIASWSGGKDSCLACYRAIEMGVNVSHIVHFVKEDNLHAVAPELIRLQAGLSGIPIIQQEITSDDFESGFKETIKKIGNVKGMVFGDIYLEEHRLWIERVCRDLSIEPLFPLWGIDTRRLLRDFFAHGFEAIVVSGKKRIIDKEWIGHKIDAEFIEYLNGKSDADVCGEKGEYHTFVLSGPLFMGRIDITNFGITERDEHWLIDIEDFEVKEDV